MDAAASRTNDDRSIVSGPPLEEQPGLGALTIPGYLREIVERFGDREALAQPKPAGVERWTYRELHERALAVARSLVASDSARTAGSAS